MQDAGAPVSVADPTTWLGHEPELARLVRAAHAAGRRAVPSRGAAAVTTVIQLEHPLFWADRPDELGDAIRAASGLRSASTNDRLPASPAAAPSQDRLTFSVEEAATALGISRALAYEAVARGEIPCVRIGKRILVPRAALARLLDVTGGAVNEKAEG